MSLETEIKNLTVAVNALIEVLKDKAHAAVTTTVAATPVEEEPKKEAVPTPTPAPTTAPAQVDNDQDVPSRQELIDLCMSIVKADRSKGAMIKALLATYNDAKTVNGVPADKLGELQSKLKGIQND